MLAFINDSLYKFIWREATARKSVRFSSLLWIVTLFFILWIRVSKALSKILPVHNIQIIKRVSENAGPYALYFRALVPLRFQLSENVPMLICILCTYQYPKMGFWHPNPYRKVLPKDKKTLREDAHAEAEENVALRRFGGAKYAFTRILSCEYK